MIASADICDAHIHIFEDPGVYPLAATAPYLPPLATARDYRADPAGQSRAVIVQSAVYGTDNRLLLDTIAADPRRLRGVAVIDPETDRDSLRRLDEAGVRGIRFNDHDLRVIGRSGLKSVATKLADIGWHLELLLPLSQFGLLDQFLRDMPIPVVIDHLGFDPVIFAAFHQTGDRSPYDVFLRSSGRMAIYMKVSGYYYLVEDEADWSPTIPLIRTLIAEAPERVVWGSNWPHPNVANAPSNADLRQMALDSCGDEETARRLLIDNAAKLYGFD